MRITLKCTQRKIVWLLAVCALLVILCICYFCSSKSVRVGDIQSVDIKVEGGIIFSDDEVNIVVYDEKQFEDVLNMERYIRKNDGTCFLIKSHPWYITITYNMKNGGAVVRTYAGQKARDELYDRLRVFLESESN